jgi:1,2-phenylacetyl-CoA epoxidase PaaB subunit
VKPAAAEPWEVFARQDAELPIRHIGRVDAATLDDAVVFARTLYEEWKWVDMFIVPRAAIVTAVAPA